MLAGVNDLVQGREAEAHGFTWVDITDVSRRGEGDSDWFSADDVHPGDRQYAEWADEIWSRVREGWSSVYTVIRLKDSA